MKYILSFLLIAIVGAIVTGFYIRNHSDAILGNRVVGLAVLAMSFVWMPLFIYHRYKNKKLKDFTLTSDRSNRPEGDA